jgi:hypothetical protein
MAMRWLPMIPSEGCGSWKEEAHRMVDVGNHMPLLRSTHHRNGTIRCSTELVPIMKLECGSPSSSLLHPATISSSSNCGREEFIKVIIEVKLSDAA